MMLNLRPWVVKTITLSVVFTAAFLLICFEGDSIVSLAGRVVLLSVKSYIPVTEPLSESVADFEGNAKEETTNAVVKEKENSTVVKNTEKETVKQDVSLNKDDADIVELVKSAKKNSKRDKKDGAIAEYTFTNDGVTDSFGVVRVKNTNKTELDIGKKLSEKLELSVERKKPSVLIYHTHTTETYQLIDRDFYAEGFLSRSNNSEVNMIRVGRAVADELEKSGYAVIHDTSVYDNPYSGAYYRSEDAARETLKKHPSIQITLDIHRDAIQDNSGTKTKPVAVIDGKKAAQIMIITGCQEEGNGIDDLPEWEKNLTFALKLQQNMETMFPGLTRPLFFCPRSYNMGLTPCSLLVEMGTDANTLSEAVYSGKMLGRALAEILKEYEVKQDGNKKDT